MIKTSLLLVETEKQVDTILEKSTAIFPGDMIFG
jgi:hypothetical protein